MARLNDPPAPATESLDALKRRFIRQNRELARVNSTQSQRIRNLETEITRLLAENIAIREQAIGAAVEAERWRKASRLGRDVVELKRRLESKLGEVNTLVEELGRIPEKTARRSSLHRRKSGLLHDLAISPTETEWRTRPTAGNSNSGEGEAQDGRLPAIMEDKYYPRRTLETEELRILTATADIETEDTESPDLGPPPIAHFEVADPIAFDSTKSPKRVSGGIVDGGDDAMSLPRNLETRRKRRTSSLLHDMSGLQPEPEVANPSEDVQPVPPSKATVKRKFVASEMEPDTAPAPQNDGFEFSRRDPSTAARSRPSRFTSVSGKYSQVIQPERQSLSPQKPLQPRTALAPKSTNSPSKKTITTTSEKHDVMRTGDHGTTRSTVRKTTKPNAVTIPSKEILKEDEQIEGALHAPKTPAPSLEDMISPPSSAIDTMPKQKSTEAAITNSVEDVLSGSIGRGSRRARAAVSYAEPNLRDKMRRPDKKLVGAVEGIGKTGSTSDRESSRDPMQDQSNDFNQNLNSTRAVKIKSDKNSLEEEGRWKTLPEAETEAKEEAASPLKDKEKATATLIANVRKKRTYSESEGTRSKHSSIPTNTKDDLGQAISRLSIYDSPNSSPMPARTIDTSACKSDAPVTNTRQTTDRLPITSSRRHSVRIPQDPAGSQPVQRPTSALTTSTRDAVGFLGKGKENVSLATSTSKLKRSSSVQTIAQPPVQSRTQVAERTLGARRRSTLV